MMVRQRTINSHRSKDQAKVVMILEEQLRLGETHTLVAQSRRDPTSGRRDQPSADHICRWMNLAVDYSDDSSEFDSASCQVWWRAQLDGEVLKRGDGRCDLLNNRAVEQEVEG
jgi:hypothetical protein